MAANQITRALVSSIESALGTGESKLADELLRAAGVNGIAGAVNSGVNQAMNGLGRAAAAVGKRAYSQLTGRKAGSRKTARTSKYRPTRKPNPGYQSIPGPSAGGAVGSNGYGSRTSLVRRRRSRRSRKAKRKCAKLNKCQLRQVRKTIRHSVMDRNQITIRSSGGFECATGSQLLGFWFTGAADDWAFLLTQAGAGGTLENMLSGNQYSSCRMLQNRRDHTIVNQNDIPLILEFYDYVCTRDLPIAVDATSTETFDEWYDRGLSAETVRDTLGVAGESQWTRSTIGHTPERNPMFKKFFKLEKVTKNLLAPGQTITTVVPWRPFTYTRTHYLASGTLQGALHAKKGMTRVRVAILKGPPVWDVADHTTLDYGSVKYGLLEDWRRSWYFQKTEPANTTINRSFKSTLPGIAVGDEVAMVDDDIKEQTPI